ncbi:MAG: hypothetical protein IKS49_06855 [Actinomycetaceae bacterium]|nr:hypothetical protein [Actinomycetaceae bacterium]
MQRHNKWRPGYAAVAVAFIVPALVLILAYRPAVNWFDARNNVKAGEATPGARPTLPVTGMKPVPDDPGFPWWAFAVIVTVMLVTLFLWRAGYKNVLAASSHATAHAVARRARSYTFDAVVHQRLDEGESARRLRGLAGSFARTALVLKGTSQVFDRIESAGTKLDLPPLGADESFVDTEQCEGMPPRLDSLADE